MSDEFRDSGKKTLYTESITAERLLAEIKKGRTNFRSWNFRDQDLSYSDLYLTDISTQELPIPKIFQKQSTKLDFTKAIFVGANVEHVKFNGAILTDADFTNAKNLEYADFTDANLEGAIFNDESILYNKTLSHTQRQRIKKRLQEYNDNNSKGCCIMM